MGECVPQQSEKRTQHHAGIPITLPITLPILWVLGVSCDPIMCRLERPTFVPEDYAALAPGLSNSRSGGVDGGDGWPSLEDWDIGAPAATRTSLAAKSARARPPSAGLQRCALYIHTYIHTYIHAYINTYIQQRNSRQTSTSAASYTRWPHVSPGRCADAPSLAHHSCLAPVRVWISGACSRQVDGRASSPLCAARSTADSMTHADMSSSPGLHSSSLPGRLRLPDALPSLQECTAGEGLKQVLRDVELRVRPRDPNSLHHACSKWCQGRQLALA